MQVRKALEGDIRMRCGSLSAKMVHSSSFDCAASGLVSIEALYGDTARINASDSITVGGSAGSIEVSDVKHFITSPSDVH